MFSKTTLFTVLSLAAAVSGKFAKIIRESDVSLTCERRGNPCLEDGPGDAEYEMLSTLIVAALEEQEYVMDTKRLNNDEPDEKFWVYKDGEWELKKKHEAANKRNEAKANYDKKMSANVKKWGDGAVVLYGEVSTEGDSESETTSPDSSSDDRRLQKYHKELKAIDEEEEKQIEDLDSFVKDLFAADYEEEKHSIRRRLIYKCGGGCSGPFCSFYCGRRRRRRLSELGATVERELDAFGSNMCVFHTDLEEFLHKYPIHTNIQECVTDHSLCIMAYPCSI